MRQGKLLFSLIVVLAFLTGFLSCYAFSLVYIDTESPFLVGFSGNREIPGDWINRDNIEILPDKVIIHVKNALLSKYADTGSMLPTLGESTNGIKIIPDSANQIVVGDIITYRDGDKLIVHRVVAKGEDGEGAYFVTKGDNNQETDGKVYWEDVEYVTIGLIY